MVGIANFLGKRPAKDRRGHDRITLYYKHHRLGKYKKIQKIVMQNTKIQKTVINTKKIQKKVINLMQF